MEDFSTLLYGENYKKKGPQSGWNLNQLYI